MSSIPNFINKNITTDDGVNIHYSLTSKNINFSNKPILIFLHGLGGDLSVWDDYRVFFKNNGYESISLDFRGHGLSEKPKKLDKYDIESFVRDVEIILRYEKIQKVVLVGHSLGGVIAQKIIINNISNVEKMVLITTTPKNRFFADIFLFKYLFSFSTIFISNFFNIFTPQQYRDHSKFYGTGDFNFLRLLSDIYYSNIYIYNFHFQKFDFRENLKLINTNTLVIAGEKDWIIPERFSKEIHKNLKNSELKTLSKANHIIVFDFKNELKNMMLNFLNTPFSK